jgi:hypothetical protein
VPGSLGILSVGNRTTSFIPVGCWRIKIFHRYHILWRQSYFRSLNV